MTDISHGGSSLSQNNGRSIFTKGNDKTGAVQLARSLKSKPSISDRYRAGEADAAASGFVIDNCFQLTFGSCNVLSVAENREAGAELAKFNPCFAHVQIEFHFG